MWFCLNQVEVKVCFVHFPELITYMMYRHDTTCFPACRGSHLFNNKFNSKLDCKSTYPITSSKKDHVQEKKEKKCLNYFEYSNMQSFLYNNGWDVNKHRSATQFFDRLNSVNIIQMFQNNPKVWTSLSTFRPTENRFIWLNLLNNESFFCIKQRHLCGVYETLCGHKTLQSFKEVKKLWFNSCIMV